MEDIEINKIDLMQPKPIKAWNKRALRELVCPWCKKAFTTKRPYIIYCGRSCAARDIIRRGKRILIQKGYNKLPPT